MDPRPLFVFVYVAALLYYFRNSSPVLDPVPNRLR